MPFNTIPMTAFQPLTETFPLWCVPQPVWFNRVDDPTTPFLAFLNVRWVLAPERWIPPRGWKLLSEGEGTRLYENPRALARAFVPRKFLEIADEAGQSAALASIAERLDMEFCHAVDALYFCNGSVIVTGPMIGPSLKIIITVDV